MSGRTGWFVFGCLFCYLLAGVVGYVVRSWVMKFVRGSLLCGSLSAMRSIMLVSAVGVMLCGICSFSRWHRNRNPPIRLFPSAKGWFLIR